MRIDLRIMAIEVDNRFVIRYNPSWEGKILLLQKYDFLLIVVACVTLFSITPESLRIFGRIPPLGHGGV